MSRIADVIFVIISAIAFVFDLLLAYFLYIVGRAMGVVSENAGSIPGMDAVISTANSVLLAGWVFVAVVLLSSAYAFWSGLGKLRAKKK